MARFFCNSRWAGRFGAGGVVFAGLLLLGGSVRAAGVRTAADCVPAESPLFLSLPDPGHTATAWHVTELYRLWSEPEVRAFFEKPLSRLPPTPAVTESLVHLGALETHDAFLALTRFNVEAKAPPTLLAGFGFRPDRRGELDALLTAPKAKLRAEFPEGRAETADHRGHALEIFRTGRGDDLLASSTGADGWYLVANDLDNLKAALDRLDAVAGATPALGSEPDFRAVRARMPARVETLIFARPVPLAEGGARLAGQSGLDALSPEQREALRRTRALGAATTLEGNGLIRDTVFALTTPEAARAAGAGAPVFTMPTLPLVSATDAVFYGSALLLTPENTPTVARGLAERGLTLEGFRAAFGEEAGIWADWPGGDADAPVPSAAFALALPVRDRAAASTLLEKLLTGPLPGTDAHWEKSPGTPDAYTLVGRDVTSLTPSLVLGERNLFFGLQPEATARAAKRETSVPGAGNPTSLGSTEAFRAAGALVGRPDTTFAFLDTRRLFERAYTALRPMAAVGALVFPQAGQFVDVDKLPPTEAIARHLSPVALSQHRTEDGVVLESVGPLTLPQIAGLIVTGAVAGTLSKHSFGHHSPASPPAQKTPVPGASGTGR